MVFSFSDVEWNLLILYDYLELSSSTYSLFRFIVCFSGFSQDLLLSKVSSAIVINLSIACTMPPRISTYALTMDTPLFHANPTSLRFCRITWLHGRDGTPPMSLSEDKMGVKLIIIIIIINIRILNFLFSLNPSVLSMQILSTKVSKQSTT